MTAYIEWNSLLLSEFFALSSAGEEVWVQTTRAELDSFGIHLGGAEGLVEAVRTGAPWALQRTHCADAAAELAEQRTATLRPRAYVDPGSLLPDYAGFLAPTYLPHLALWVLASSEAEDGFYAHVDSLLETSDIAWTQERREKMASVWRDLQRWSHVEAEGLFGLFSVRVLGEHRFVGVPRSQCLMSPRDHANVVRLFHELGLRPGQQLTDLSFKRLIAEGHASTFLSSGLRHAMESTAYLDPLFRLLWARLESWDGQLPRAQDSVHPRDAPDGLDSLDEATPILVPCTDGRHDWALRWRVPAVLYSGTIQLKAGDVTWGGTLERLGTHAATKVDHQAAALDILQRSMSASVRMSVTYTDDADDNGGVTRSVELRRKLRRILAWDSPDAQDGVELVERELPIKGPAYLLASPTGWGSTKLYLERERIRHEGCSNAGLPTGWNLVCIPFCERLDSRQRDYLSDGQPGSPAAARIRFVGGRPIIRGGTRRYAFYDLPLVEVEALREVTLVADGLVFEEIPMGDPRVLRRTYRMVRQDAHRALYDLQVLAGEDVLARCTLRVTAPGGAALVEARAFGIDPLGRSTSDGSLRGVLRDGQTTPAGVTHNDLTHLENGGLGEAIGVEGIEAVTECAAAKFLDSLARLGSMSFGVARDQLSRLSARAPLTLSPALVLLELRARAHLELETDHKGHLVRVHSVAPHLYTTPAAYGRDLVLGFCGTPTIQQWHDLARETEGGLHLEMLPNACLPVLRVACGGREDASRLAASAGFAFSELPAVGIARWAGSLQDASQQLTEWGWTSLGSGARDLQRLQPASAVFNPAHNGALTVDPERGRDLFRFEDPDIRGQQVYVLGTISGGGTPRYSYVHDSRWGVWLDISAFAEMAKRKLGIDDACPWPITYLQAAHQIWIPARLRPPFVLERALTLCSGGPPHSTRVAARFGAFVRAAEGEMFGPVSSVYEAMLDGSWVCYRWIPPYVANEVARRLGASLRTT